MAISARNNHLHETAFHKRQSSLFGEESRIMRDDEVLVINLQAHPFCI